MDGPVPGLVSAGISVRDFSSMAAAASKQQGVPGPVPATLVPWQG